MWEFLLYTFPTVLHWHFLFSQNSEQCAFMRCCCFQWRIQKCREGHFCDIWKNPDARKTWALYRDVALGWMTISWKGAMCKRLFSEKCRRQGGMTIMCEVHEAFLCKPAKSEAQERLKVEMGKSNTQSAYRKLRFRCRITCWGRDGQVKHTRCTSKIKI